MDLMEKPPIGLVTEDTTSWQGDDKQQLGSTRLKIAHWLEDKWMFPIVATIVTALGVSLIVGGAIDLAKSRDPFSSRHLPGGTILAVEINQDTARGAVVVEYELDNKRYQIYDIVTDPLMCSEREKWLDDMQKFIGKTWPTIRYNPADPKDSTLVEKTYNPTGIVFVSIGSVVVVIMLGLVVFRWLRK